MSDGSTGPTDDSPSLLTSILRASSASGSSRGLAPKLKASLDLLLLGLRPDEEYAEAGKELDRLAASVPKSSCGRGFQKGDVIWKCKTCAIGDDTCVVCQAPPRIHAGWRTSKRASERASEHPYPPRTGVLSRRRSHRPRRLLLHLSRHRRRLLRLRRRVRLGAQGASHPVIYVGMIVINRRRVRVGPQGLLLKARQVALE